MSDKKTMTISRMAAVANVQRNTIYAWRRRDDWPGDSLSEKQLTAYAKKRLADEKKRVGGADADLRRRKLEKQIAVLTQQEKRIAEDVKAAAIRNRKQLGELADWRVVAEYWIGTYSEILTRIKTWRETETAKNPSLRKQIQALGDGLQRHMVEVLEEEQEKHNIGGKDND